MIDDFEEFSWRPTNAPVARSRTDDFWFIDERRGWAVNGNGQIISTDDGGETWVEQAHLPRVYSRCIRFANESIGWAGTLTINQILFHTNDGGQNWQPVTGLPDGAPVRICGLSVVDENTANSATLLLWVRTLHLDLGPNFGRPKK